MKAIITITPLDDKGDGPRNGDFRWRCIYQNLKEPGKPWYWLTDFGQTVKTAKTPKDAVGDLLTINKGDIYEIQTDTDADNYDELVKFWKYGRHSKPKGEKNPNLVIPYFEVSVSVDTARLEFELILEKKMVSDKIFSMLFGDLRDAAYSIGTNPEGLSHTALIAKLIGTTYSSDAMLKRATDEKGRDIPAILYYENKSRDRREVISTVHKAIFNNIIKWENNVYTTIGHSMGDNAEKAINFCENNYDVYSYVQREVRAIDKWTEEDDDFIGKIKLSEARMESEDRKKAKVKSTPQAETVMAPAATQKQQIVAPPVPEKEEIDEKELDDLDFAEAPAQPDPIQAKPKGKNFEFKLPEKKA